MVSPLAKGLFQRAFLQSGQRDGQVRGIDRGRREEGNARGHPDGRGRDRLRHSKRAAGAAAERDRRRAGRHARALTDGPPGPIGSTSLIDGWAIPKPVDVLLNEGSFHRVPILIGANADEGSPVVSRDATLASISEYHDALRRWYGDKDGILAQAYPVTDVAQIVPTVERLYGDEMYGAPARAFARLTSAHGARVFFYYFTRVGEGSRDAGAFHGAQQAFFWGGPIAPSQGRTPYDASLARTMSGYLAGFAATGDPNGRDRPRWPAYEPGTEKYLEFGADVAAKQDLRKADWDAQDRLARSRGAIRP